MTTVIFKRHKINCDNDKSLLDNILSQGAFMPYSCKGGICQACLSIATKGTPPPSSQEGLKPYLKEQGCFYACLCHPTEDMEIENANKDNVSFQEPSISAYTEYTSMVIDKTWLNDDVLRLCIIRPEEMEYKAGQFINIIRDEDKLSRSYSLASLPCENFLELHIKRVPNGQMSNWLCDDIQKGDNIRIAGPSGECYYQTGHSEQELILAAVGTGLAPLYGILRDALESGHHGKVHLFHASLNTNGLYYQDEIWNIINDVDNLTYIPCVLNGEAPKGGKQGMIDQIVVDMLGDCTGKQAYLCGDDVVVQDMKKRLLANGLKQNDILADVFVASK